YAFDHFTTYTVGQVFSAAFVFVAGALLWRLGPYAFPAQHD
ncbi:MAG: hypothetical protein RJB62_1243, partial [Pseudomonadota bacterium]